ncbi:GntR family transcriptional regulator [Actinocrinis puniceicyclus]|uniref:GntR family transcriptional regulator n=1 Tax=Actinocrinis puniceicyclus TaxID=977794 RepID=A0A8J7WJP8_9ACTN|nr:GntR family transcriptional regulator [Actinocrinis puniceicyclus]MBS2962583.1 GntR family transcriptional regulator [Actinocrinis puniceicyclus]
MRPIAKTPRYALIADGLRQQIIDGTLAPGSQMPSLAELVERYRVSERTAYEATRILLNEGLTVSRPGAGSFVRSRPDVVRMVRHWYRDAAGKGSPWRAEMAAAGRHGSWIAESTPVPAPPAIAERLQVEPGERLMRTLYVFTADDAPTYLSTSWEPLAVTGGTQIMLPEKGAHSGKGVVDRFGVIGVRITRATEELVPRTLTIAEAEKLRLRAGISVIVIERTYYAGDTPVETANIVLPPSYHAVYEIPVGGSA